MAVVYIQEQGAVLRKTGERLRVTLKNTVLLDRPLINVSQVVVFGQASITAATVQTLLEKEIEVCYLTQRGRFVGRLLPAASKNGLLRRAQYRAALDAEQTLALARQFVIGKLSNMRTMLLRYARKERSSAIEKAAEKMKAALKRSRKAVRIEQLRGHEGEGSAAYFSVFNEMIEPSEFSFRTRVRRPPTDPVNALLSFGYALLANELFSAVNIVGLDPYAGYLHADSYGRPSLPLDLMEEFRAPFIDSIVLSCLNKRMLKRADFQEEMGAVSRLTDSGLRVFLTLYEERKQAQFQHPQLKQTISYQRAFEQQARFLGKTLQGELTQYPPLMIK
ncbi:type I-D CRISPR-associated endonuclease Cas1 [candidate division KSB3 bacterium]|uniref:CRISPR-associated endonuclease Cas1 n=1 Tax=candidate division KSB3 bacterium TaxID=2044937 RepID=A0A2G6E5B8_9BACT|nr:MAG: type I-D CRISPR-associated endonuclease Cas1 [candidate division KSB3 bacterium]PIE29715.1 MAG: type I-D CRISPR-associated endonuclease Cas1 [candidate division KSB3 bacterium]